MLAEIDSLELSEFQAFYELDPWGEQRADLRIGQLCALTFNPNRKKGAAPATPADFMLCPDVDRPGRNKKSTAQLMAAARFVTDAMTALANNRRSGGVG